MIIGKIDLNIKELTTDNEPHFCYLILCENCGKIFPRSNYIVLEYACNLKFCCHCCKEKNTCPIGQIYTKEPQDL